VNSYPRRGLHGRVVQVVGQRIAQGVMSPEDAIDVVSLETEFGVSRTVVRESLKVLAAKGLVDARPKRGTFVRPRADWSMLDPDLLRWRFGSRTDESFIGDLAEVRLIVEPAAARLAAGRRTEEELARLDRAIVVMGRLGATAQEVIGADIAFHCGLLRASHNELLERMEGVIEATLRTNHRALFHASEWHREVPQHRLIADAVRARDEDAAEHTMRALLTDTARRLNAGAI
jgi:GntR family transcriptional regulator, galactonate operon transcriptional repressor